MLKDRLLATGAWRSSGVLAGASVTLDERPDRIGLAGARDSEVDLPKEDFLLMGALLGTGVGSGIILGLLGDSGGGVAGVRGVSLTGEGTWGSFRTAGTGSGEESWLGRESLPPTLLVRELGRAESGEEEPRAGIFWPGSVMGVRLGKVRVGGVWGWVGGVWGWVVGGRGWVVGGGGWVVGGGGW